MRKLEIFTILGIIAFWTLPIKVDFQTVMAEEVEDRKIVYEQLNLFGEVFDRVRSTYVESVDTKDLIRAAINGMLQSLDPHSSYLNSVSKENTKIIFDTIRPDFFYNIFERLSVIKENKLTVHKSKRIKCEKFKLKHE